MTKYVPRHLATRANPLDAARLGAAAACTGRRGVVVGAGAALPLAGAGLMAAPAFAAESATPAPSAKPAAPVLAFNARGEAVERVQARLALVRDGWFGPVTTAAVKDFQRANGLVVDGVVGAKTWAALSGTSTKADAPAGSSGSLLSVGAEGALVRTVQSKLGVTVDGVFGPRTEAAVRAFQRAHGLADDGIVGPRTTYALARAAASPVEPASQQPSRPSPSDPRPAVVHPDAPYELPFPQGYIAPISQGPFGQASHYKINDKHHVDWAVPVGTRVVASASGVVFKTENNVTGGNTVLIRDASGYCMEYAHLSSIGVSVGQRVTQGQQVALSGNTGNSTGPHLHWGIVECSNYTSIKIADSVELGTTYIPGTVGVSRNES